MWRGVVKRAGGGLAVLVFVLSAFGGGRVEWTGVDLVGSVGAGDGDVWLLVALVVGAVASTVLAVVVVVRVVLPAVFGGASAVARAYRRVTPDSRPMQAVVAVGILVVALVGVYVGMTSVLIQDVSKEGPASAAMERIDHHRSLYENETGEMRVHGDGVDVVASEDQVAPDSDGGESGTTDEWSGYASLPDADGDGLPDAWERNNSTPWGTPLPDADPQHKDIYVQLRNGTNVDALNESERAALAAAFAEMEVSNPDGESGIDLHIVTAASLDEPVSLERGGDVDQWYTRRNVGAGHCTYYQVVYGVVENPNAIGRGSSPGYASVVDGRPVPRERDPSQRVQTTVHELLHNVVGEFDSGGFHTSEGWLASGTDQFLAERTSERLNASGFETSRYYHLEVCGGTPPNASAGTESSSIGYVGARTGANVAVGASPANVVAAIRELRGASEATGASLVGPVG